jgi:hypothetical protein
MPGGLVRGADDGVVRGPAFDARVVDQDVQPAVGLDRLGRRRDGGVVGHVELDKPCAQPLGGRPAALALILMSVMALATAWSPAFPFGATANPATDLSPGTIRDTIADMVARIVGPG